MSNETHGWVAGYNMVGYLPEMDPFVTDDWGSAASFLGDEMQRHADLLVDVDDGSGDADLAEMLECIVDLELIKDLNEETTYVVGNTAYWIVFAGRIVPTPDGWEQLDV